jgi:predicted ATP-grasp superfamily ATP-dependent carboligase
MRVFIFEYVTGGGCADDGMLADLATEGDMMLAAVVCDLLDIEGVEVTICRDRRLLAPELPIQIEWVDDEWKSAWLTCLDRTEAVLPIAPETDGILERLCHDVALSGRVLLNSPAEAVALAASKQATIECLEAAGLPVVPSWRADRLPPLKAETFVVKPDRGVGCQDIRLLTDEHALIDFISQQHSPAEWLVQPYIEGSPASLSLMVGTDGLCLLGRNIQHVAMINDRLVLLGCVVNGLQDSRSDLFRLAQQVCQAMPGLWGYVGIDLVIGDNGPVLLEVNPRLTTSYVGLSKSIGNNVAELMLRLAKDPTAMPDKTLQGDSVFVEVECSHVG